jgi:23S rRNA pseudouridine2605 synthase
LLHPRYGVLRTYEVTVRGRVTGAERSRWERGVMLEDGPARPVAVEIRGPGATSSRLRLTFTEGRKHEVKRYCEALGHPVTSLRRVAFGPITLGTLPVGKSRPLTPHEVHALRAAVASPPSSLAPRARFPL